MMSKKRNRNRSAQSRRDRNVPGSGREKAQQYARRRCRGLKEMTLSPVDRGDDLIWDYGVSGTQLECSRNVLTWCLGGGSDEDEDMELSGDSGAAEQSVFSVYGTFCQDRLADANECRQRYGHRKAPGRQAGELEALRKLTIRVGNTQQYAVAENTGKSAIPMGYYMNPNMVYLGKADYFELLSSNTFFYLDQREIPERMG